MVYNCSALFGVLEPGKEVRMAVDKLRKNGFSNSSIKLLYPGIDGQGDIERLQKTMILYFAKLGAYIGAIAFLIIGVFIVFSAITGDVLVNMNFLGKSLVLIFVVLFGTLVGAASGALIGIGTPQPVVLRFADYIDAGATLLSVQVCSIDEESIAKNTFESCGARDIAKLSENDTWDSARKARSTCKIGHSPLYTQYFV